MQIAAALIYWVIVALWLAILATVTVQFIRNPRVFGTTRLLLLVVAIDTLRNLAENTYFGLYFGSLYGFLPAPIGWALGNPALLILPKFLNIIAGCFVLGVLLMRWLPGAVRERKLSEEAAADLERLATTDGLTALTNRRHFETLARAEWARFQRYGRPLSLMVLDVDKFKSVNDRYGHDAGDIVLKAVAHICKETKRQTDTVARIGGEEFAMLLPETGEAAAEIAAERLRKAIEAQPMAIPNDTINVTISIGIAGAALGMASFEMLLKRADEALYEAKRTGRNRIVIAKPPDTTLPIAAE